MSLRRRIGACALALLFLTVGRAWASCGDGFTEPNEECDDGALNGSTWSCCTPTCASNGKTPDVIVGDIPNQQRYGNVGGITSYSIGTTSCNLGNCWLKWVSGTNEHPVIGQNMFRLKDGRFEHIGQAWLKHGFTALAGSVCGACSNPSNGARLGVNCSDPYESGLNGNQLRLGPKVDVNSNTGEFPYPDARINVSGDAIFKRLQVHDTDLNPTLNPGALYFVEGQYVTRDDAAAKNHANNASYRRVTVGAAPTFSLTLQDTTQRQKAGIEAWRASDAAVVQTSIKGSDGTFLISAKATSLGGGLYHYEYAVQNITNQRAGQSFTVPIQPGATITNVGFHDVDYHSGEPFDGTDWTPTVTSTSVSWATTTFDVNPNANALRWGTLYNFRFDANVAPGTALVSVGYFKPGSPAAATALIVTPGPCGGAANGVSCNDLNACTQADACTSGLCSGTSTVTCTALDQCHDVGTCQAATGTCSNPAKPDGTGCTDSDLCTQTDACVSGACFGSNPVSCTPLDQCHDAGACQPATGACSNPNKPNGATCDDANACTADDACAGGTCVGGGPQLPLDVGDGVALSQSGGVTTITWAVSPGSEASSVLRGLVSQLPVGPGGGEEFCLETAVAGTSTTDANDPGPGESFWYLVRGVSVCGSGPYGDDWQNGIASTRQSTTCP